MKAALIGDIHANLPALEAVLAHAQERGVSAVWNVGDFVGYGPFPDEVVQLMRKRSDTLSILGNYDRKMLQFKQKQEKMRKHKLSEKYLAFEWCYENVSKKNRKYLASLSGELRLKARGYRILLTHGSPVSEDEPLTPDVPDARLSELAKAGKADIIIFGHSHQEFVRQVDKVWFINTGSVGRPIDGDPRARYAIIDIETGSVTVEHFRVEYDINRVVVAIHQQELPEAFAQMFVQGRDLLALQPEPDDA